MVEHTELLALIGDALGLDRPYREWPVPPGWWDESSDTGREPPGGGPAVTVLAGAVDREHGRIAWVEEYTHPPAFAVDGELWVTVLVNVSGGGLVPTPRGWMNAHQEVSHPPEVSEHLTEDRADLMQDVLSMEFSGDTLSVVYRWRGSTVECRLALPVPSSPKLKQEWIRRG